jgi:hypothetical protein
VVVKVERGPGKDPGASQVEQVVQGWRRVSA